MKGDDTENFAAVVLHFSLKLIIGWIGKMSMEAAACMEVPKRYLFHVLLLLLLEIR